MPSCQEDSRSFFEKLQNTEGLDLRDNRGKKHDLAVVLVGVTIAVLSNRDGCLSSIHRHLANHYEKLVGALGIEKKRVVSRSQLPLILEEVAVPVFDHLVFENYSIELNGTEKKWFALDGKELRGSIEKGAQRSWRQSPTRAAKLLPKITIAARKNQKSKSCESYWKTAGYVPRKSVLMLCIASPKRS